MLSDKFFGTYGDDVTVKSGFEGCSFGKLRMTHDYGGAIDTNLLSAPGVLDITINVGLHDSTQATIVGAMRQAVNFKLKMRLPGPFDHVVFVVERCYPHDTNCQFAA